MIRLFETDEHMVSVDLKFLGLLGDLWSVVEFLDMKQLLCGPKMRITFTHYGCKVEQADATIALTNLLLFIFMKRAYTVERIAICTCALVALQFPNLPPVLGVVQPDSSFSCEDLLLSLSLSRTSGLLVISLPSLSLHHV